MVLGLDLHGRGRRGQATITTVRVQVGDVRLYFDVAGMGLVPEGPTMRERPVVVCLHGGPGFDHSFLKLWLAPLQQEAQLVFLDHRGQGRSDESVAESWNLDTWIEDVHRFCGVLGIERPVLLGQSFGGVVALGVAIRHPDLPRKLIVSSSIARFRLDRALPMFERLGGDKARRIAEAFFGDPNHESLKAYMETCLPLYNPTPLEPDVLARVRLRPEVGFHFFRGEAFAYDWIDDLGRVRCPTLVLAGDLDPITPVADQEEMAAAIPDSRLEIFADAGHGVFRDRPKEALATIRDFILS
jgi:pimeloyl-ACP methyl ester carboxylesterase